MIYHDISYMLYRPTQILEAIMTPRFVASGVYHLKGQRDTAHGLTHAQISWGYNSVTLIAPPHKHR